MAIYARSRDDDLYCHWSIICTYTPQSEYYEEPNEINGTCPLPLRSVGNHLLPPHRRDFKDCKQILEDSLMPTLHIKARSRLQPDKPSEDLPLWHKESDSCLSPPANLANSAILPTAKISTFLCKISLPRKSQDSSCLCPSYPHRGSIIDREHALPRPSAMRSDHTIT